MNLNKWMSKIKSINKLFFNNKDELIKLLELTSFKYLFFIKLRFNKKIYNMVNNYDYITIWDGEFQNFLIKDLNNNITCKEYNNYIKNTTNNNICSEYSNNITYKETKVGNIITILSEIGLILLIKLQKNIYFSAIIHINFMNYNFTSIFKYRPIYSTYMSVTSSTRKKIEELEEDIYPHLIFINLWNSYKLNKDKKVFETKLIELLNKTNILTNKISNLFKEQISLLNSNNNTNIIINDICIQLKKTIHTLIVDNLPNNYKYIKIIKLYLDDNYVKSTLININNHKDVIRLLNNVVAHNKCLNIVKGTSDIYALYNHNLLLGNNNVVLQNVIDIADYNNTIYKTCGSAKLYESYNCLHKIKKNIDITVEKQIKAHMFDNFLPHNPLVDSYYTLQIFILYNIIYDYKQ